MSEADLVIGNEEYDEEEIDHRRTLVLNNPHLYLTKKKNLKDAAIIARKKCNPFPEKLWMEAVDGLMKG